MEISTAILLAIVLLVGLWFRTRRYIRRGRARGHTWFTWWKRRVTPTLTWTLVGSHRLDPARTMRGGLVSDSRRIAAQFFLAYTRAPPRYVASTWMSFTWSTGQLRMSRSSTMKSASLPGSSDPFRVSSNVRKALLIV